MKLIACNSNIELAKEVANDLGVNFTESTIKRFSDNETFVEIHESVRGADVFVLQSTSNPANEHILELLICIDALRRASARRITAVMPYYGYARQDRKSGARTPITAKLVADAITNAGANKMLTIDLHSDQIQGFFNVPVDNLHAAPVLADDIKRNYTDIMIISPDAGGVVRARNIAKRLNSDLAVIDKRREKNGVSEVMNVIGDVKGKNCILIDDIADTAGTLCNAAKALIDNGAKSVSAYVTHGVLSGEALNRIESSVINELVITNTIRTTDEVKSVKKIRVISIAHLIASAIKCVTNEQSIADLL
jgi:ribose-phosphate pyrophosphokinase